MPRTNSLQSQMWARIRKWFEGSIDYTGSSEEGSSSPVPWSSDDSGLVSSENTTKTLQFCRTGFGHDPRSLTWVSHRISTCIVQSETGHVYRSQRGQLCRNVSLGCVGKAYHIWLDWRRRSASRFQTQVGIVVCGALRDRRLRISVLRWLDSRIFNSRKSSFEECFNGRLVNPSRKDWSVVKVPPRRFGYWVWWEQAEFSDALDLYKCGLTVYTR